MSAFRRLILPAALAAAMGLPAAFAQPAVPPAPPGPADAQAFQVSPEGALRRALARGVYQVVYSPAQEALYVASAEAIPNVHGGLIYQLDPVTLETTGLIAVDPEAGYLPEVSDITENKLNLEFVEVEAAQTAGLLPDVAAAFINGGHAVDNGYFPAKDAILIETVAEGSDNPYVNILVARTADKDNPLYQRILEVYHTDEVAEIFATAYKGAYLPAWK